MRNTRLNEAQTRVNIAGRNISNLRYADNVTLKESKELKKLLMKVEKCKSWLKNSAFRQLRSWHPGPSLHGK